ncbi:exosortase Z [Prosthecobacter vanneervenii]|uniref:Exosortase/archaeosortase family protein n=1 Tax=Prosthecobacter vanneervenii TaxID=48466 RepID=A0A7W8DIB9_9BACT|nr:archaeosortase/exosortase family protein [Prosthecobacter vanneervenii]MBB5030711.1 exosortase/archaeosortase family protein [Prosthecobacter vanneervenii]
MAFRPTAASLRTTIAAVAVAAAVHLTQSKDMVVDFTRPIVLHALQWLGNDAADCGDELRVGRLMVPWTRDCAGINLLLILLALAVWVNRRENRAWRFWLCMAGMVPAAVAANVLRVLTLLTYRTVAYPGVESPQTHYFMGFMWLVPFIALITPRDHRPASAGLMETLHAAAVVALLAPMAGTPNATLLTLAAIISLSHCRLVEGSARFATWPLAAWVVAGLGIAVVGMESFWLPWLLICPLLVQKHWVFSIPGAACLACTHSLVAMQSWSWAVAGVGLAWAWRSGESPAQPAAPASVPAPEPQPEPVHLGAYLAARAGQTVFMACLALPFLASTLLAFGLKNWEPPAGMLSRCISPNCYEVRLPGQPDEIGLACYSSASRDRHHTLNVCLKYRGIELQPVEGSPDVLTDGKNWFREFFLQDGHLLPDYPAYVRATFRPWSDPGVHLIFVSRQQAQHPGAFNAACEELAQKFYQKCLSVQEMQVAERSSR